MTGSFEKKEIEKHYISFEERVVLNGPENCVSGTD